MVFVNLLMQIRDAILVASTLLLLGSLIGAILKRRYVSEETVSIFGEGEGKPGERSELTQERRRSRRLQSAAVLELQDTYGKFVPESARMHDISLKGACFDSTMPLKRGQKVMARLYSSKEGVLQISARVVWSQPRAHRILYGIEFNAVDPIRFNN